MTPKRLLGVSVQVSGVAPLGDRGHELSRGKGSPSFILLPLPLLEREIYILSECGCFPVPLCPWGWAKGKGGVVWPGLLGVFNSLDWETLSVCLSQAKDGEQKVHASDC